MLVSQSFVHATGFANGVKIGEIADSSVIHWTGLTVKAEPGNQAPFWKPGSPNWTPSGEERKIRFSYRNPGNGGDARKTGWTAVDQESDFRHQTTVTGLLPETSYRFAAEGNKSLWRSKIPRDM